MFDITDKDIQVLNDTDLEELVAKLCQATLVADGFSPSAVTHGGDTNAPDGGVDVRVESTENIKPGGDIPRPVTLFQVKKPTMPKTKISKEMSPGGVLRSLFKELSEKSGAYIIACSGDSLTDKFLTERKNAMREALSQLTPKIYTDFYDAKRLADWVNRHPDMRAWVKEKTGSPQTGWQPYQSWSAPTEPIDTCYLTDEELKLSFENQGTGPAQSIIEGINRLRSELSQPHKAIRLVGLSGVGKTRLVQALFDERIGSHALHPSLAVYTDTSFQPLTFLLNLPHELIAHRKKRAILIIDNCPADFHRKLVEQCLTPESKLNIITIEYDIRDDQPEETLVVRLDTSSLMLIEKIIGRKFPKISDVDRRRIAEFSGGNARIAISLANTVEGSETISGLKDEDLFQRLFRQRNNVDESLFLAAQVCALVYSFDGETLEGEKDELPILASLIEQSPRETYRHMAELLRRELAQKRDVWRAVLPHAIANRLAAKALENIPNSSICERLVYSGSDRLARSFSRRLSFLHKSQEAIKLVKEWLASDGYLGNVAEFNSLKKDMFKNIAPVLPEATCRALESVQNAVNSEAEAAKILVGYLPLLRSLAYDATLFEPCCKMISVVAKSFSCDETFININRFIGWSKEEAISIFSSLFPLYLSGTQASLAQRLKVIEDLLTATNNEGIALGIKSLEAVMRSSRPNSPYNFEFGSRSRDHGYDPKTRENVVAWYREALLFIERMALDHPALKTKLQTLFVQCFKSLWLCVPEIREPLEKLVQKLAINDFYDKSWRACKNILEHKPDKLTLEERQRLVALENELKPKDLVQKVNALLNGSLNNPADGKSEEEKKDLAMTLGVALVEDEKAFSSLLPRLTITKHLDYFFVSGLIDGCTDLNLLWDRLVQQLRETSEELRSVRVFKHFLTKLWETDKVLANKLLDQSLEDSVLARFFPELQSTVDIDEQATRRLKHCIDKGVAPISSYCCLYPYFLKKNVLRPDLEALLLTIANQKDGFAVAIEIFGLQLHSLNKEEIPDKLLEFGHKILQNPTLNEHLKQESNGFYLEKTIEICLKAPNSEAIAAKIALKFKEAAIHDNLDFENYYECIRALFVVQPTAILDAFFSGNAEDVLKCWQPFNTLAQNRKNLVDDISPSFILSWCDQNPAVHYPIAASFITYSDDTEDGKQKWSPLAIDLLKRSPDPGEVLRALTSRFAPSYYRGQMSAILERKSQLLEDPVLDISSEMAKIISEEKLKQVKQIKEYRDSESKMKSAGFE